MAMGEIPYYTNMIEIEGNFHLRQLCSSRLHNDFLPLQVDMLRMPEMWPSIRRHIPTTMVEMQSLGHCSTCS